MAITYPLDYPVTIGISDSNLQARSATGLSESPFTFAQQTYEWPGSMWMLDIQMPLMNRDQAREYTAFLSKLYGRTGTFTIIPPCVKQTAGFFFWEVSSDALLTEGGDTIITEGGDTIVAQYSPTVDGADQTGNCLNIDGLPVSETNVFRADDFIQIGTGSNTRLYQILEDIDTDADGKATLPIFPKLRKSPADDEVIIYTNPKGLFRLSVDTSSYPSNNNCLFSISFTAMEVVSG